VTESEKKGLSHKITHVNKVDAFIPNLRISREV